ncbi:MULTISPECIES: glycosyltransferase [unclassified Janthinobacterium]|uniref:glycosyltransferase n=1 Tax=unclassified Janthinobacterium TaxID=2610881 RepID=UPI0008844E47|nr:MULTISPECIES: glycosyltransferase [unclassified Janthinobacterium]SDA82035.1 Glycosyltransferase involved in cell wall bisynthesis [Janthinobacterium sp. 551a]SFB64634.1 Glycosyltransferase involved in cell wall bisynthesis [Janthinobacterium sp. 344]
MKFCDKLTFVVFTYNEEKRIERVLRNFTGWGHILVVDNHSTDLTRDIAEKYGATVILHKNPGWVEDENTVTLIKQAVNTPWIYWGFADEILNEQGLLQVVNAIESDKFKIINLARKNFYYGKFCHDAYADRLNRVFQKAAIDFTGNKIHSFGKTTVDESAICYLDEKKYYVRHFISNTSKIYLATIDRYTDIEAKTNKYSGGMKLFARLSKQFIKTYFIGGAYKAGTPGLFFVIQMMYYQSILAMKTYEREHALDVDGIEKLNNIERENLLGNK